MERYKSMDIIIRNLDPKLIAIIDNIAKEKGQSRQEFLKNYVETLGMTSYLQEREDKYVSLVNQIIFVLKENTYVLDQIRKDFLIE
jgi:hypothetical protein